LQAERLWPEGVVLAVCAPDLARKVSEPDDFVDMPLLRTATPQGAGRTEPVGWKAWFHAAGAADHLVERTIGRAPRFGTTQLALDAAVGGRGVAVSPRILVEDDLTAGRLVAPLAPEIADPFALWLLHHRDRADEVGIRRFATWVRGEAAASARTSQP
jgi:DNA-binding transcriptional LysR family regulator